MSEFKEGDDVTICARFCMNDEGSKNYRLMMFSADGEGEPLYVPRRFVRRAHPDGTVRGVDVKPNDDAIEKLRAEVERIGKELRTLRCGVEPVLMTARGVDGTPQTAHTFSLGDKVRVIGDNDTARIIRMFTPDDAPASADLRYSDGSDLASICVNDLVLVLRAVTEVRS